MPSQINTKSCPERISFAPLRHGRYFNRDIFVPRCMRKNWISKREKGSGSLFSASPKICCAFLAARVKNVFDVDVVRVYHLLQAVIVLLVCKSQTRSIIILQHIQIYNERIYQHGQEVTFTYFTSCQREHYFFRYANLVIRLIHSRICISVNENFSRTREVNKKQRWNVDVA